MSWIGAGIAGASALFKIGSGIAQNHSAGQIEKNNPYPTYTVDPLYKANLAQANQMAQVGLPQQQYNNQANNIQQNQAGAIFSLSRSANPGANLAAIVRQGDQATGNLNAQDAVARNRNMLNLLQQRQQLAQQNDKAWDWNYQQKYLGNLAKSQALRTAGNTNINSGANDVTSTALTGMNLGMGRGGVNSGFKNRMNAPELSVQGYSGNGGFGADNQGFNPYGADYNIDPSIKPYKIPR